MKYKIDISSPHIQDIKKIKAGDLLYLNGELYTARDQAHLRLYEAIKSRRRPPVNLKNKAIYYTGPTPKQKKAVIGSCGPTTSSRMDLHTPALLNYGVKILIGKGTRNKEVIKSLKKNQALYLIAPAGCGAYLSTKIMKAKPVAYKDLGAEAIYKLEVKDFPVIVCVDSKGKYLYK